MTVVDDEAGKAKVDEAGEDEVKGEDGGKTEKEERKNSVLSTFLLAALPIMISVLSAYYAYSQVQVGKAQNQAAAEQQLVTVVTEIAALNASDNTTTQVSSSVAARTEELTYGQAGANLISSLPPQDITATDYVQVGKALQAGGDYGTALAMYDAVASEPQDPDSFADAKRNAAGLWYQIADNKELSAAARSADEAYARSDTLSAANAYAKSRYVELSDEIESIALTYLDAAGYQAMSNCSIAFSDVSIANKVLGRDKAEKTNPQIKDVTRIVNSELGTYCP